MLLTPPRVSLVSPSVCWCPPSVCVVVVLNGGARCVLWYPCSNWILPFTLYCSPCIVPLALCVVGGEVWWRAGEEGGACYERRGVWAVSCPVLGCVVSCPVLCCPAVFPPLSLCPLSQHCWFSVVFLWRGCVVVEWRWCVGVCSSRCLVLSVLCSLSLLPCFWCSG